MYKLINGREFKSTIKFRLDSKQRRDIAVSSWIIQATELTRWYK